MATLLLTGFHLVCVALPILTDMTAPNCYEHRFHGQIQAFLKWTSSKPSKRQANPAFSASFWQTLLVSQYSFSVVWTRSVCAASSELATRRSATRCKQFHSNNCFVLLLLLLLLLLTGSSMTCGRKGSSSQRW
jgi:hypothetical protein